MGTRAEAVAILVIEDNNDGETWDHWFQRDFERRREVRDDRRRFVRHGDVCRTAKAGYHKLLEALNENLMPDLVVIDEMLETGGIYSRLEPLGLKNVLRPFRDECRSRGLDPLPTKCVLWSQRYTPGLAHAFVASGGTHAFGRDVPSAKLLDHLWEICDANDVTWRHAGWSPPRLELKDDQMAVLPYLEADLPTHEIATRMKAAGEIVKGPAEAQDWVNEKRRQIRDKANRILSAAGEPLFQGSGHSTSLARFAIEHGNVWTPLEYRDSSRAPQ
jgi:hypothetical protein